MLNSSNQQKQAWNQVGSKLEFASEQIDGCTNKADELKPVLEAFHRKLKNQIDGFIKGKGNVLDYGCGSGRYLSRLEQERPELNLFGMDFSDETLRNFTTKAAPHAQLIQGDLSQESSWTKSVTETFDGVYSVAVLQYIAPQKLKTLFNNFKIILKKDGVLILCFPVPTNSFEIFRHYHYVRYPPLVLENLLVKLGFKIVASAHVHDDKPVKWTFNRSAENHGYWIVAQKL